MSYENITGDQDACYFFFFILSHTIQYNVIHIYNVYKFFTATVSLCAINKAASMCV